MEKIKRYSINRFLVVLSILISVFWLYAVFGELKNSEQRYMDLAVETAEAYSEAVRDIREWATRKGGVYVQTSTENPPNMYLEYSQRVLMAEGNLLLTNLNPAYVTRQISEITKEKSDIQFNVVSVKPVNPSNEADDWESNALNSFSEDAKAEKIYEVVRTEDGSVFKYITPMYLVEGCQNCHVEQRHIIGELRGGISVTFPFETYEKSRTEQIFRNIIIYTTFYIMLIVFIAFFGKKLVKAEKEKETLFQELETLAHTDKLTGLASRHYFFQRLEQEISHYSKYRTELSLIVIDMNGFKQVNDVYGHLVGDKVLIESSKIISNTVRPTDLCGRLGGDEFIIMLPETTLDNALEIGQRIALAFEQTTIHTGEADIQMNVSIGVASLRLNEILKGEAELRDKLIAQADKAMYVAKDISNKKGGSHVRVEV